MMSDPNNYTIGDVLAAIHSLHAATELSFSRVDQRIDAMEGNLHGLRGDMNRGFDRLEVRVDSIDKRVGIIDKRVAAIEGHLGLPAS